MSTPNPYSQYLRTSVETASPTKLVVMLYDGAIKFLLKAVPAVESKNYTEQNLYLTKAQKIIAHLYGTLDYEKGGNVAVSLSSTYIKMYDMLTAAHIKDDVNRVNKVIHSLRELREAWVEVDKQMNILAAEPARAQSEARDLARAA